MTKQHIPDEVRYVISKAIKEMTSELVGVVSPNGILASVRVTVDGVINHLVATGVLKNKIDVKLRLVGDKVYFDL